MSGEASGINSNLEKRRVFFACAPDAATEAALRDAIRTFASDDATRLRWLESDNWHVTFRFVGNVPADIVAGLADGLAEIAPQHDAFDLPLTSISVFPSTRRPSVLAAVGVAVARSVALVDALEEVCVGLGLEAELRPWRPHLTLARIRGSRVFEFEAEALHTELCVREIALMESVAAARGRDYVQIARACLVSG